MSEQSLDAPAFGPSDVLKAIEALGLSHQTHEHRAVYTVDEAKAERGEMPGAHIKNLFLRNKKGRMWVVTFLEDRTLDLRALGTALGTGRLSFASPERMMRVLGVIPGAVTPLGVVNDLHNEVELVLDSAIFGFDLINVHPLVNTMTTTMQPNELVEFVTHHRHEPTVLDLDSLSVSP